MIKIHLAPMEGVVDWVTRDLYSKIGGFDQCVTEFIRVSDRAVSEEIFFRYMPELKTGSHTRYGVPVLAQLLGGKADFIAESAVRAVELGACGIDLNFGCPAKTVNRHDGGAALLREPHRIENILSTVRRALPAHIPLSAKIRLGFDDPNSCIENSLAVQAGGAQRLTIHCRTKMDMYKPPAYWDWIPKIKEHVQLPIVANGEIWTLADYIKCKEITGCDQFMIGRGALSDPFLALKIKFYESTIHKSNSSAQNSVPNSDWDTIKSWVLTFFDAEADFVSANFAQARTKQWLRQLSLRLPEAQSCFNDLKVITNPTIFREFLQLRCQSELNTHATAADVLLN